MASASNFRTALHRRNVIYTRATLSRTKASAKRSVMAATLSRVTSCIQIRAQLRPFQVKAMFKQHVNIMIWTWILRLQTASRNEFTCKNEQLRLTIDLDVASLHGDVLNVHSPTVSNLSESFPKTFIRSCMARHRNCWSINDGVALACILRPDKRRWAVLS